MAEVMARHNIKGKVLAMELGLSTNAVSNLKTAKTMPQLTGEKLDQLCNALNKVRNRDEGLITPNDLIEYIFEFDEQT